MTSQTDPLREWYRNEIWGQRAHDDDALFEVMSLQIFQSGLTWRMILNKRDGFRQAFRGWKITEVAALAPDDIDEMLRDTSIIRNRKKIEACIENARIIESLREQHGAFCRWFYDVLEGDELGELQSSLRSTFKFMGPEITRMWLLASGRISPEAGGHG